MFPTSVNTNDVSLNRDERYLIQAKDPNESNDNEVITQEKYCDIIL